jgi:hypothetical protein
MATAGRHTHTHAHARTNSLTLPSSAPTLYSRFEGERTQLYNDCYQIKFDLETQAAEREEGTVLKAGIAAHDAGLLPPANSGVNLNKKIKPEAGWGPRMNLDGTVSGANSLRLAQEGGVVLAEAHGPVHVYGYAKRVVHCLVLQTCGVCVCVREREREGVRCHRTCMLVCVYRACSSTHCRRPAEPYRSSAVHSPLLQQGHRPEYQW